MTVQPLVDLVKLQGFCLVALVDTCDHPIEIVAYSVHLLHKFDAKAIGGKLHVLLSFLELQDQ
jgi:hypothetical protein